MQYANPMSKTSVKLFTLILLATAKAAAAAPICEDLLAPPTRLEFIHARNAEINAELKLSPNRQPLEKTIASLYANPTVLKVYPANAAGEHLEVSKQGLGKPFEIRLKGAGKDELVLSSFSLKRNGSYDYFDSALSADQKTLVVAFARDGSIDDCNLIVLDVPSKKILSQNLKSTHSDIVWVSPDEFLFPVNPTEATDEIARVNRNNPSVATIEHGGMMTSQGPWAAHWTNGSLRLVRKTGESILMGNYDLKSIVEETVDSLILEKNGPNGFGQVVSIPKAASETQPVEKILRDEDRLLVSDLVRSNTLISQIRWGAKRWIQIRDLNGRFMDEIPVPDCCLVSSINWAVPGQKLSVGFSSDLADSKTFTYDLQTKSWDRTDFIDELLKVNGVQYLSYVVNVPSQDGTMIPLRITRRAQMNADGNNPVLFKQYGGFNSPGNLDPVHDPMIGLFIEKGGIYATPALRGGNEYGPDWHRQAMFNQKHHTMEDLVSAARWMTAHHWTQPSKIIITGGSNGGLTVAATGMLYPDAFGLVIPVAGVHDLLNKEELDPRFGPGWLQEYGDARTPEAREWLKPLSPVELAKQGHRPQFLLINGRNDSRVNPEHTYRLTENLLASAGSSSKVRMVSLNNAGHFMTSIRYQDRIAWRVQTIQWSTIYDFLGWKHAP